MTLTHSVFLKRRLGLSVSLVGMVIGSGLMSQQAYGQPVGPENDNCFDYETTIICGKGDRPIAYAGEALEIYARDGEGMSAFNVDGNAVSLTGSGDLVFDNSVSDATSGGGSLVAIQNDSLEGNFYGVYIRSKGIEHSGGGGCCSEPERPSGSVNAKIYGNVTGGVYAENINQTGLVDIETVGQGKIESSHSSGIIGSSVGGSGLSIKAGNSSVVSGHYNGISVLNDSSTGGVSIATGTDSTITGANGSGILASIYAGTDSTIDVGDRSEVSGSGSAGAGIFVVDFGTGGLSIETGEGSTVTGSYGLYLYSSYSRGSVSITNAGKIAGSRAAVITPDSEGDSFGIVNSGSLVGPMYIGYFQAVTVTNAAGGTWETSGVSDFGGRSITFTNNGNIEATESTSLNFPSSGSSSFTNNGNLKASGSTDFNFFGMANDFTNNGSLEVAGTTSFNFGSASGAGLFDNSGILKVSGSAVFTGLDNFESGTGTIDMVNGSASDNLGIFAGNYSPGGTLSLDVLLNGADSKSDKLAINSEQSVPASETSGVTKIELNYLSGGSGVAPVDGLVLVESSAELPAGTFILDQSLTGSNLFFTDSVVNRPGIGGGTEIVLERQFNPDTSVLPPPLPPPSIITVDAEPKLDSAMGVPGVETPGVEPGPYVQTVGSAFSADTEGTLRNGGESFNIDAPYDMTVVGVIAGLDRMQKGTSAKGTPYAWLIGGFGGYVTSNATFVDRAGSQQSNGGVAGAYAAAAYGPWRFHLAAKTDFGVTEMSTGSDSDHSTYLAPGVAFNAGYRYQLSPVSYLQPIATLSYVHRSLGDVSLEGTDISYSDTESLRGRIGVRIASFGRGETHTIEPWMQASLWHEFLGESQATFTGASGALDFTGLGAGTFAEVGGGVNVLSQTVPGLSGNLRTELSFGERSLIGLSGKLGVEYRFPVN